MLLEVGTIVEGKVTGITKFGAFVSLPEGKSGMVHISEVANAYVSDIHDHLSEGQTVKVKIIGFTPDGKINLSIKKAEPQPQRPAERRDNERRPMQRRDERPQSSGSFARGGQTAQHQSDPSFEDKLKQFMQEADSKMSGSRYYEQQRKSRRRKD